MKRTQLHIHPGPGGWVAAKVFGDPGTPTVYFRFLRERGELVAGGLWVASPRQEDVHAIPIKRIVRAVNADSDFAARLTSRLDEPAPEPGGVEFYKLWTGFPTVAPEPPPISLERPAGRLLDDDFYARVAAAYREAAARGLPPRTEVAKAAGVSTDVAGRWAYEARKRGHLAKTDPGKVAI